MVTRDAQSTAALHDLGYTGEMVEASDVALRLPYDPPAPRSDGPSRVGINVSGLLMNGGYTGKNELGITLNYPQLIRDLIADFRAVGAEVHLVPHVIVNEGRMVKEEDDARAQRDPGRDDPRLHPGARLYVTITGQELYRELGFLHGRPDARLHCGLFLGVPVVPMAYSRKLAGLFRSLGYPHTVDCTREDADTMPFGRSRPPGNNVRGWRQRRRARWLKG